MSSSRRCKVPHPDVLEKARANDFRRMTKRQALKMCAEFMHADEWPSLKDTLLECSQKMRQARVLEATERPTLVVTPGLALKSQNGGELPEGFAVKMKLPEGRRERRARERRHAT